MQRSETRILTTHTGSLPRPAELVALYLRKNRGEAVDAQLAEAGRAALDHVVRKQREAGIDIGNNGEQQREAFFLYVRSRMSGFGGAWTRMPRADVERYPDYRDAMAREQQHTQQVSSRAEIPTAIGEVRYLDHAAIEEECTDFRAALDAQNNPFVEPFLTAPSPGIVAAALRNDYYPNETAYLEALGEALRVEYEAIVRHGFLLQLDCPDLAMERHISYQHQPLGDFLGFVDRVVATINAALVNIPRDRVRLHACWGNYEGPHDCDVELHEIMPILRKLNVGGFVLPFANPRHAHEYAVLKRFSARCRPDHRRRRDRLRHQLRRASEDDRGTHRARRRGGRRSQARAGRHGLRLRHIGRTAPRRRGHRVGEARRTRRRRADRLRTAVLT